MEGFAQWLNELRANYEAEYGIRFKRVDPEELKPNETTFELEELR